MVGKDILRMSLREVKRLKAVHEISKGHITQKAASSMLDLSERQVRRLVRAVKDEGDHGVVHRSRGRRSNRKKRAANSVMARTSSNKNTVLTIRME